MMILCFVLKLKKVELTADLVFLALSACPNLINQILSDVCSYLCFNIVCLLTYSHIKIYACAFLINTNNFV